MDTSCNIQQEWICPTTRMHVLQHTLQHAAKVCKTNTHYNTPQDLPPSDVAVCCDVLQLKCARPTKCARSTTVYLSCTTTGLIHVLQPTLQHPLQLPLQHPLQHTATHCHTLQHTLTLSATDCSTLATHCKTLQHNATVCIFCVDKALVNISGARKTGIRISTHRQTFWNGKSATHVSVVQVLVECVAVCCSM